jgi:hypothetical protein
LFSGFAPPAVVNESSPIAAGMPDATESTRPLYGDINGDGYINAADTTLLRRYIASIDKAAFRRSNTQFRLDLADLDNDGQITATDVTVLRAYIATPGTDTKPILGPPVVIEVDLFAERIWREHYGSSWDAEARSVFSRARIPFATWRITLSPSPPQEITFRGHLCTNPTEDCSTRCCGQDREGLDCYIRHRKSAPIAFIDTIERSNRNRPLAVSIVGYRMCGIHPTRGHTLVYGFGLVSAKGAVGTGYLEIANTTERYWRTIRTMQHELSHNYGLDDKTSCPTECIMTTTGFRDVHENRDNIWCSSCRLNFKPSLYGVR